MNNKIPVIILFLLVNFLISCTNGANNVSTVKLFPVRNGDNYQYINNDGQILINPQFNEATVFRDGLALVSTSGKLPKWGFISEDGKFVIQPIYKSATIFSEGIAWVVTENGSPTAINRKGEIIFKLLEAEKVNLFSEGLSAFSIVKSSEIKWGFVDNKGNTIITAQYYNTGNFSNGLCAVQNNKSKWGYINKAGEIVINYQFDRAYDFIDGNAIVELGGKSGVINKKGKYLINPQFNQMINDGKLYLIEQDDKWGWCDKKGRIIINPQFLYARPFMGNKLAPVQTDENWGYVNLDGRLEINPQFESAYTFNGNVAVVHSNDKIGFIDNEGKYIINPIYNNISWDYRNYIQGDNSFYEYIDTDYFNIKPIVNRVNINLPEGLFLTSKLSDVINKLKVKEDIFNQYKNEHLVLQNENITNDASYDFYIVTNAYKDIQDGWYTKKILNIDAKIEKFAYVISLDGKGYGKEEIVKEAIEETFKDLKIDLDESMGNQKVFKNNNMTVRSSIYDSQVVIVIENIKNKTNQLQEDVYED